MKSALLAVPMTLAFGTTHSPDIGPARTVFSPALFAPLATSNPEAQKRWQWPASESFHQAWLEGERAARPIRLVRGSIGAHSDIILALTPGKRGEYEIDVVFSRGEDDYAASSAVPDAGPWKADRLAIGTITFVSGERNGTKPQTLTIDATYLSPEVAPTGDAFADWIYVTTLLTSDEPVYAPMKDGARPVRDAKRDAEWTELEEEMKRDTTVALARIESLLESDPDARDWRWGSAASFAATHDPGLARRIYRVYRPVGGCSMDTRPAEVAREYAELCYRMGDLGCYLQLSVQIMGNQFSRVAWGSYAEPIHHTHADKLVESGLDVDRFLVGLAVMYGTEKPRERELGPWRLARSIHESGHAETVKPDLVKMAEDEGLDEMNRLRATIVLAWIGETPTHSMDIEAREKIVTDRRTRFSELAKRDLSPVSRAWLDEQLASMK